MYRDKTLEERNSFRIIQSISPRATDIYHILGNLRRRIVLWRVGRAEEPVTLDDLITTIAEQEPGSDTTKKRHSIRIALHQHHFPILEDAEVLHINKKLREYQPGPKYRECARIMAFVAERTGWEQPPVARGQHTPQPAEDREGDQG